MRATNPRTGKVDYAVDAASPADIAREAERLRAAQPAWEALGPEGRAERLRALADAIETRADAIVDRAWRSIPVAPPSRGSRSTAWSARCAAGPIARPACSPHCRRSARRPPRRASQIEPRWSAYPLFGAIAPWNFPVVLSHIDAVPALAAGCAALVKPSEVTPRFVEPMREAFGAVPDVPFAYVLGGAETGRALVEAVDYVCFTGSTATGRKVAEAAARRLIPANLELGGKDPMIVTASADPEWAARIALRASVVATGQACQSIERIYVAQAIAEPFLTALVREAEAVTLAVDGKGDLGPFIHPPQADTVAAQIADARAKGARVLTGGRIETHGGGRWLRPTVLADVTPDMAVMREETFGPVLPVTVFDTVDEAVALANDSAYGLSAAVLAGSLDEAAAIGARLDAGAVSLQDGALTSMVGDATNHSRKGSGLGPSRMGDEGLTRFLRRQALIHRTGDPLPLSAFAERSA